MIASAPVFISIAFRRPKCDSITLITAEVTAAPELG